MKRPQKKSSVSYNYSGSSVIVSGGGRGIGRAVCEKFSAAGASVICVDIEGEFAKGLPKNVLFQQADITKAKDCARVVGVAIKKFGGVDILVNSAVIQPPSSFAPAHLFPEDLWNRMVAVNFSGYQNMGKAVLTQMVKAKSGVVINIASAHAHASSRGAACYGPLKAANMMQTKQWALEYARQGIRVASVSPGATRTQLVIATLAQQGGEEALANRHACGRLGEPEEIADSILYLASDGATFVYGADLQVDGGLGAMGSFAEPYPLSTLPKKKRK